MAKIHAKHATIISKKICSVLIFKFQFVIWCDNYEYFKILLWHSVGVFRPHFGGSSTARAGSTLNAGRAALYLQRHGKFALRTSAQQLSSGILPLNAGRQTVSSLGSMLHKVMALPLHNRASKQMASSIHWTATLAPFQAILFLSMST